MPIYTHNQSVGTNLLYPLLSFCICRTIPGKIGKVHLHIFPVHTGVYDVYDRQDG